jgi:long-chain acyl-CoA synthetase
LLKDANTRRDNTMPPPQEPGALLGHPFSYLDEEQRRWLAPLSPTERLGRRIYYSVNRLFMRILFGTRRERALRLPSAPFLLCPNHTSSLDVPAIAATLDYDTLAAIRWAGRRGAVLRNPLRRFVNRLAGTVPVDRDITALAVAGAVVQQGSALGWFPEGTRTTTGELQEFKPGIGSILYYLRMLAVPVYIDGAFEAWPPTKKLPRRLTKVAVRFGKPLVPDEFLDPQWDEEAAVVRLTEELRRRVEELRDKGHSSASSL